LGQPLKFDCVSSKIVMQRRPLGLVGRWASLKPETAALSLDSEFVKKHSRAHAHKNIYGAVDGIVVF
jgi:hypothetical protein